VLDVLTAGRISVDIYPLQTGVGLDEVETFGKYLGGSATNVAVAAARYGRASAVITRTGDDSLGRFVHRALKDFGVADQFVTPVPGMLTPVVLCEIFPPDDFPLYFYGRTPDRARHAADRPRLRPGRRARHPDLLDHGHRPLPGAERLGHHGGAAGP
jgi:sugar/nucleoside kinase (ribokinase family)